MNILEDVPLASLTTFRVGGTARFFAEAVSIEDVCEARRFASQKKLPIFVLGAGSNILIADSGFDGLVLAMRISGITYTQEGGDAIVTAGAGVLWDDLVVWSIARSLAGLECLSGIPGTVGGAVVANLGAYGAQCSDSFIQADGIDVHTGESVTFKKSECDFAYHDSVFSHTNGRYIIVCAAFTLSSDRDATLSYRDNRFDLTKLENGLGRRATLQEVRDSVLTMREEKGSLIMKDRLSFKCAGSFFHMPFVSEKKHAEVEKIARSINPKKEEQLRPWAWKQADGSYKIAPGFLLEYTEFRKGYMRGDVGISPRHTLSIINAGDACAHDIAMLAHDMQEKVLNVFGISLEQEVEYVGDVEKHHEIIS